MKSYKTALGLFLASSVCAALVACNKGGGNAPVPAPAPLPVVVAPQNQFQARPFGQVIPGQIVRPKITNNGQFKFIKCYGVSLDYSSTREIEHMMPIDFPPMPFDNTKVESFELPYLYSATLGKIVVKAEPDVLNAQGNLTHEGTLELSLTETQGSRLSSIKSFLDSHLKLELDDTKKEKRIKVDCGLEVVEYGQSVPLFDSGNPKLSYSCKTSVATSAEPVVKSFTVKSKPQTVIPGADELKLENGKDKNNGDIVLVSDRKAQSRIVKLSVPFGHEFLAVSGNSSTASASIMCSAGTANATQQK